MKSQLKLGIAVLALGFAAEAAAGGYQAYGARGYEGRQFICQSVNNRQQYCRVDTRGGVQLIRQISKTRCQQGYSWGYDRDGVWVSHGCRAQFVTGQGNYGNDGYGGGYGRTIRCDSNDNRTKRCAMDTRGGVQLIRQVSKTQCRQGYNWGYDRSGVWVSRGCRAEFAGGYGNGYGNDYGYGQTIRCESKDNRQRTCNVNVRRGATLVRQLSKTQCRQGYNWGWNRSGIWVNGGCRAEFRVD